MKKQKYNPLTGKTEYYFDPPEPKQGPRGERGRDGKDGIDGKSIQGPPGKDGIDGKSIKGDKGDKGDPGRDGKSIKGDPGKDGINQNPKGLLIRYLINPPNTLGQDGDWCLLESNELLYKRSNKWEFFTQLSHGGTASNPAPEPGYDTSSSSQTTTYLANGEIDVVTFYDSLTQITANRLASVQMNYNVSLDPSTEVWTIYRGDGTTTITTITFTYTFTGDDLTNTEVTVA